MIKSDLYKTLEFNAGRMKTHCGQNGVYDDVCKTYEAAFKLTSGTYVVYAMGNHPKYEYPQILRIQ